MGQVEELALCAEQEKGRYVVVCLERVQAYERRMSMQQEPTSPKRSPPLVPPRNRLSSTYGLAPKASLYVANPDHRQKGSDDS